MFIEDTSELDTESEISDFFSVQVDFRLLLRKTKSTLLGPMIIENASC